MMADAGLREHAEIVAEGVHQHVDAAREASTWAKLIPRRKFWLLRHGPLWERALNNLYAAEADLLTMAPATYLSASYSACSDKCRRTSRPRIRDATSSRVSSGSSA